MNWIRKSAENKSLAFWLIPILLCIPALVYLPGISGRIPFPSGSALQTDLLLTHYPNALYLKNAILEQHGVPLWSSLIYSGTPFAANPLAGLFYLPGWLALLFPLPAGISVVLAIHSIFGAWGFYLLLKEKEQEDLAAVLGALIFGLMPKMAAHYGAGHISLLYAISWTPWLLFFSKTDHKGWLTGCAAAGLFLADPRWAVYAGIFSLSYQIAYRHYNSWKFAVRYYFQAGLVAFLLSAPLLFPMLEFLSVSSRSQLKAGDILSLSLPPENLLGLIIPNFGVNPEWFIYSGGAVIALFAIQFFIKELRKKNLFWIIWIFISIGLALGSGLVKISWIDSIPIISLLRVPSRFIFLSGISLAVICGTTINFLVNNKRLPRNFNLGLIFLILFSLFMVLEISIIMRSISKEIIWGFGFLFFASMILLILANREKHSVAVVLLAAVLVTDLLGSDWQSFSTRQLTNLQNDLTELGDYLLKDEEIYRIYSPSFSMPQYFAAENSLEMADGVDPLQIVAYRDYMVGATGIPAGEYFVTIPPFKSGNPALDNRDAEPDAGLLGLLNVKYLSSAYQIESTGFRFIKKFGNIFLYQNERVMPRAWIDTGQLDGNGLNGDGIKQVSNFQRKPNQFLLNAEGPGRLVLSEIVYPGWVAYIDGQKVKITPAFGILRSVHLPSGFHQIELRFLPIPLFVGLGLAGLGWIIVLWKICRKKN